VLCDSNLSLPVLYMTNNNMYLPVGRTQTQWSESIQVLCDSNLLLSYNTCIDSDVCVLPTGKYILLLLMYNTGKLRLLSHNTCMVLCDSNLSLPVLYMTNNNMYLPVGRTQTQSSLSIQELCDSNLSLPVLYIHTTPV
jgi:hypothetical protein